MFQARRPFHPNAATIIGGLVMSAGSLIYLNDAVPKARNLHTFLWPAMLLMALGAVVALVGAVHADR